LPETSGDFAEAPEHPNVAPMASSVSKIKDNLAVFMFFPLTRSRLNPGE
jgi:hypothetical protein